MIRGDHFNVSVTSNVREHLEAAIAIAWADSKPATHYKVEPLPESWDEKRLTAKALLLSYQFGEYIAKAEAKGWKPLPFPLTAAKAATFAWDWLETADRGQPTTDTSREHRPRVPRHRRRHAGSVRMLA